MVVTNYIEVAQRMGMSHDLMKKDLGMFIHGYDIDMIFLHQ